MKQAEKQNSVEPKPEEKLEVETKTNNEVNEKPVAKESSDNSSSDSDSSSDSSDSSESDKLEVEKKLEDVEPPPVQKPVLERDYEWDTTESESETVKKNGKMNFGT